MWPLLGPTRIEPEKVIVFKLNYPFTERTALLLIMPPVFPHSQRVAMSKLGLKPIKRITTYFIAVKRLWFYIKPGNIIIPDIIIFINYCSVFPVDKIV